MKINIAEKDIGIFIDLLYLGNWIINSNYIADKMLNKYEKVFKQLFRSVEDVVALEYEDLYDRVEKFIQKYNSDVFPSEFARQYADLKMPIDTSKDKAIESFETNREFRENIEKEILKHGLRNIQVTI